MLLRTLQVNTLPQLEAKFAVDDSVDCVAALEVECSALRIGDA